MDLRSRLLWWKLMRSFKDCVKCEQLIGKRKPEFVLLCTKSYLENRSCMLIALWAPREPDSIFHAGRMPVLQWHIHLWNMRRISVCWPLLGKIVSLSKFEERSQLKSEVKKTYHVPTPIPFLLCKHFCCLFLFNWLGKNVIQVLCQWNTIPLPVESGNLHW